METLVSGFLNAPCKYSNFENKTSRPCYNVSEFDVWLKVVFVFVFLEFIVAIHLKSAVL